MRNLPGVFAKELGGFNLISGNRLFCCGECPEVCLLSGVRNLSMPISTRKLANTFDAGDAGGGTVHPVLTPCDGPEIGASIVCSDLVNVISEEVVGGAVDNAMKQNDSRTSFGNDISFCGNMPCPILDEVGVILVNEKSFSASSRNFHLDSIA